MTQENRASQWRPVTRQDGLRYCYDGEELVYGLIGKMLAMPGKREELLTIMLEGSVPMPGCKSYIVALDPASEDGIWITEVWDNKQSHIASLNITAVQATIARARPLIAGFGERFETEPLGGQGL